MVSPGIANPGFVLWSESLFLWTAAAYGVTADPLEGETAHLSWRRWGFLLASRVVLVAAFSYLLSNSIVLSGWLLLATLLQPLLRYRVPLRWLAEFECFCMSGFMVCTLALIRYGQLAARWTPASVDPAHLAALCITASVLFMVVRGGTCIVRGVLRKCGTLPSPGDRDPRRQLSLEARHAPSDSDASGPGMSVAASVETSADRGIDVKEYNRGRLIGDLERIVLTIVVAGGSYAALAFLVAAKGVVRSDEFENNRDFAEYFLIGSLSSVLVALCAGLTLRFALLQLWPGLLGLQMQ
jgi:hypothetical protein